ncbi:xaa-Pro aminopeptidase 1-like isoform X2 [Ornithodoros turicata]|uniref:xaa-Pro aminopeptidase 1-like isoform X2 n=1 Tax=Ornithodoros turicata TaxID=34597 RepID=UPI003139DF7B
MDARTLITLVAVLCTAHVCVHAEVTTSTSLAPCNEDSGIRVNTTDRLRRLRHLMRTANLSGYIIPSEDAHHSEFVPEYTRRLQFISGFSGSAGMAVVLQERAGAWTDSRYTEQIALQVDCNWRTLTSDDVSVQDFIREDGVENTLRIGVDTRLVTQSWYEETKQQFRRRNIELVGSPDNLIDVIWTIGVGRPTEPYSSIQVHELKYSGETWQNKTMRLRSKLSQDHADAIVITALDEIAWLFNLRGKDVPHTPVFESFALVTQQNAKLYIKRGLDRLGPRVKRLLNANGCNETSDKCVMVLDYRDAYSDIPSGVNNMSWVVVTASCSYALCGAIPKEKQLLKESPLLLLKAIKNSVEIEGMKRAHLKDCVAQASMYSALERDLSQGRDWTELKVGKKLKELRKEQTLYQVDSFETIAASGPNAAKAHYLPTAATDRKVSKEDMLLVDTGGQYLDGTVDITRTWHFGDPTHFQKEAYTRVLMGVINLFSFVFRYGITDAQLDVIARAPLFDVGLMYGHGTGHGIGSYLGVHDGPPRITYSAAKRGMPLSSGMFFSIEPGYYRAKEMGIRLETTAMVVEARTKYAADTELYLKLEPVAFLPFDSNLILRDMLTPKQVNWLNKYNENIMLHLGKELAAQKRFDAVEWLRRRVFVVDQPKCSGAADAIENSACDDNILTSLP